MNIVLLSTAVAFLATSYKVETRPQSHDYEIYNEMKVERESQYYCFKLKSCTPGGPKVCGYDQDIPWLAEFEDLCTLYQTNCKQSGNFYQVDIVVCETRLKYDKEHGNETFEVIHIRPTASSRPVLRSGGSNPPKVKLYNHLFASYHCHLQKHCTPGGGWVCGEYDGTHASFPDKCHLHGVNCQEQGAYKQISTELCQPIIHFQEAPATIYYGQKIGKYSTLTVPETSTLPITTLPITKPQKNPTDDTLLVVKYALRL